MTLCTHYLVAQTKFRGQQEFSNIKIRGNYDFSLKKFAGNKNF